jgi:hypothetical protein
MMMDDHVHRFTHDITVMHVALRRATDDVD